MKEVPRPAAGPLMPATVVIGGQWGDEGKGRIVDLLARNASVIARYSAGNNAGHTIINDMGLFALHLVPAGVFYADKTCLIGNGVAIDPAELLLDGDRSKDAASARSGCSSATAPTWSCPTTR